jgi:hypothetical protein
MRGNPLFVQKAGFPRTPSGKNSNWLAVNQSIGGTARGLWNRTGAAGLLEFAREGLRSVIASVAKQSLLRDNGTAKSEIASSFHFSQ